MCSTTQDDVTQQVQDLMRDAGLVLDTGPDQFVDTALREAMRFYQGTLSAVANGMGRVQASAWEKRESFLSSASARPSSPAGAAIVARPQQAASPGLFVCGCFLSVCMRANLLQGLFVHPCGASSRRWTSTLALFGFLTPILILSRGLHLHNLFSLLSRCV
jgi:hypothetical protein